MKLVAFVLVTFIANLLGNRRGLGVRALNNQCASFEVWGRLDAVVLNPVFPIAAEKVEAQGVLFGLVEVKEFVAERRPLRWIDEAFEDGVLDALAVVEAGFGDACKASLSGFVDGGHIIADED